MDIEGGSNAKYAQGYFSNLPEPSSADVNVTLYYTQHDIDELNKKIEHFRSGWDAASNGIERLSSEIAELEKIKSPGAQPVPEGMVLVPIEPTEKMLKAMALAWQQSCTDGNECYEEYKAMLEAAKP